MSQSQTTIDIGKDFSSVPAGRHPADGDFSGETFRERLLAPALRGYEIVEVVLDNTEGFGSSFLDEAFGGLVRVEGFTPSYLKQHLKLTANRAAARRYAEKIRKYMEQ